MRLLNQERRIIIVLNCNFVSCSEATKSSEVVNTAEAFDTVPTVSISNGLTQMDMKQPMSISNGLT